VELPVGVWSIAFADNLALIVTAKTTYDLASKVNRAIRAVEDWLSAHQLELNASKTEAVIIKGPRNRNGIKFYCRGERLEAKNCVKYLGIQIDSKLFYREHVKLTVARAEARAVALARLMPNLGGPGGKKRQALCGAVQSILLFGAEIWNDTVKIEKYKKLLGKAQRKLLVRICSAYRTTSTSALQVISGTIPIHLLAQERGRIYVRGGIRKEVKDEERLRTLEDWQREWEENVTVAQWTKHLIPDVRTWYNCKHRLSNYYLSQILGGHGCFRTYLKRIGKIDDENCLYCGNIADTVPHTVFGCGRWTVYRNKIRFALDEMDFMEKIISSREAWEDFNMFCREVIKKKEEEERTGILR
jgi:hypothetical protein